MAETSVFESARVTHEEIEQYEKLLADTLNNPPRSGAHRLHLEWQLASSELLDKLVARHQALSAMYADATHERADELEALARHDDSDAEHGPFAEFYARLGRVHEYYRKYAERAVALQTAAAPSVLSGDAGFGLTTLDREFSGEETGGRFLDLYVPYDTFINLDGVRRLSYLDYVSSFDHILSDEAYLPRTTKRSDAYQKYVAGLRQYLSSFRHKTRPLEDNDALEAYALQQFEHDWDAGTVPGWEQRETALYPAARAGEGEGIWCEACRRSYAKQTVYDAHLSSARHQKLAQRLQEAGGSGTQDVGARQAAAEHARVEQAKRALRAKLLARDEALVRALGQALADVREETRANVERKAALTEREREEEAEEIAREYEEAVATGGMGYGSRGGDDDEEERRGDRDYNPLNLPLDFDGRPIPVWMYKLHGLGVEYKCEICSDFVYRGRKNFEKHFQESRHAFGMRALGLPNLVEFRDVTRIQDAFALAEKLKRQERLAEEDPGDAEEVEDEHGNAYTRKTYDLLKRQGLV